MRVWIDDERNPQCPTIQARFGAVGDEVWVKTSQEAIAILKTGQVTFVSFDHDLGYGGTGIDVANWVEQQAFNGSIKPFGWRVHSMNPVGRVAIIRAMTQANKFWQ